MQIDITPKPIYIWDEKNRVVITTDHVSKKQAIAAAKRFPPYSVLTDKTSEPKTKKKVKKFLKKNGFDYSECWNLDSTIAAYILPRLAHFKKVTRSHPWCEQDGCASAEEAEKLWKFRLNSMIVAFYLIVTKPEWEYNDAFSRFQKESNYDRINEGLLSFACHYQHLWD